MPQLSNKVLAAIVITAIVVSLGSTLTFLNKLTEFKYVAPRQITGRTPTEYANISLEVSNQVSIFLNRAIIDFGSGFVNTSCNLIEVVGLNFTNLTATNSTYLDTTDCWTGTPPAPGFARAFLVENNGNLNASVALKGPDNLTFFSGYSGDNPAGIQARGAVSDDGGCPNLLNTTWFDLSANETVCGDLLWQSGTADEIAVEINVKIPKDIPSGIYENSSIEFYAVQS